MAHLKLWVPKYYEENHTVLETNENILELEERTFCSMYIKYMTFGKHKHVCFMYIWFDTKIYDFFICIF